MESLAERERRELFQWQAQLIKEGNHRKAKAVANVRFNMLKRKMNTH